MSQASKAQLIAEEYLRRDKPPLQQQNALTLLRVLGGPANAVRIAREAASNADPVVRKRAVLELSSLSGEDRATAVEELRKLVEDRADETVAQRAYTALGAMSEAPAHTTGLWRKAQMEFLLYKQVNPSRGISFHKRTLIPAGIATAVASLLMLAYLYGLGQLVGISATMPPVLILLALVTVTVAGPLVTLRSIPFQRHFHRPLGVLAECVWPLPFFFAIFALVYLVTAFLQPKSQAPGSTLYWSFVFPFLVLAATGLACRLGVIAGPSRKGAPFLSLFLRTLAGASLATVVLTTLLWFKPVDGLAAYWPTLVPVCFGLAAAFAAVEGLGANEANVGVVWRWPVFVVAVAGFGVLFWLPVQSFKDALLTIEPGKIDALPIQRLPYSIRLSLPQKTSIYFSAAVDAKEHQTGSSTANVNSSMTEDKEQFKLDAGLANGQAFVTSTASPASDSTSTTSSFAAKAAVARKNQNQARSFIRDVGQGRYSILVWDGRWPLDGSQAGVFTRLFTGHVQSEPSPSISAKLMLTQWTHASIERPKQMPQIKRSVSIPDVPFVGFVRVEGDREIVSGILKDDRAFGDLYHVSFYRRDKRTQENKPPTDKKAADRADAQAPSGETFDRKLAPGEYVFVVDQKRSTFRPPPTVDKLEFETQSAPPSLSLTLDSFVMPEKKPGEQGRTVVPAQGPIHDKFEIPGLPYGHWITVTGQPRDVQISVDADSDIDFSLGLYTENGRLIASDFLGSVSVERRLDPGRYYVIVATGAAKDPGPRAVGGRIPLGPQTPRTPLVMEIGEPNGDD